MRRGLPFRVSPFLPRTKPSVFLGPPTTPLACLRRIPDGKRMVFLHNLFFSLDNRSVPFDIVGVPSLVFFFSAFLRSPRIGLRSPFFPHAAASPSFVLRSPRSLPVPPVSGMVRRSISFPFLLSQAEDVGGLRKTAAVPGLFFELVMSPSFPESSLSPARVLNLLRLLPF